MEIKYHTNRLYKTVWIRQPPIIWPMLDSLVLHRTNEFAGWGTCFMSYARASIGGGRGGRPPPTFQGRNCPPPLFSSEKLRGI